MKPSSPPIEFAKMVEKLDEEIEEVLEEIVDAIYAKDQEVSNLWRRVNRLSNLRDTIKGALLEGDQ